MKSDSFCSLFRTKKGPWNSCMQPQFTFISNSNPFLQTSLPNCRSHTFATFVVFLTHFIRVCSSGLNPLRKRNGLWAILAIRVCMDPHFKNRPEIVDHTGTFGILFSTYYALGHTYFNLTYYLGWIVWTLGCRAALLPMLRMLTLKNNWYQPIRLFFFLVCPISFGRGLLFWQCWECYVQWFSQLKTWFLHFH